MLFTSHTFIFGFVPVALLTCFLAARLLGRAAAILSVIALSLVFYCLTTRAQPAILLVSLLANYLIILAWFATGNLRLKRSLIGASVAGNLAALAYYKYAGFLAAQSNTVFDTQLPVLTIALPLAISFFTFQQIAYALDVHAGRVKEHRFLDYTFCVTFFPHLIAGPIVNYRELIPQLKNKTIFGFRQLDIVVGLSVFAIGLVKKTLLADTFAGFVDPGFSAAERGAELSAAVAWKSVIAYTFQIYFDFSGYSDMAIGLARLFGVHLPVNFASPYKATSIVDFWRRWHITLSRFLRDYLYVSLGGNRRGRVRRYINLMVTMLLGGLWHGANWTFVLWGAMHGLLLILNHAWRWLAERLELPFLRSRAWVACATALTFLCVVLTWVPFRAESIAGTGRMFSAMFGLSAVPAMNGLAMADLPFALLTLAGLVIVFALPNTQEFFARYRVAIRPEGRDLFAPSPVHWRASTVWLVAVALLGGAACFYEQALPQFLYWGF
jgi:alginate O-acetyltransferase complex protein AlgI